MLILTRRLNESIDIGNGIKVTILDLRTQRDGSREVRFGIAAPENVPVHRFEIHQRIERERSICRESPDGKHHVPECNQKLGRCEYCAAVV